MSERLVRLLYAGLEQDVGFDSQDYQRIRAAIEDIEGVRHCRELRSVGPSTLIERMVLLAEVRQRVRNAYERTDIQSARMVATRVIDEMAKEMEEKLKEIT